MAMNRQTNTITPGEMGGGASIPQPAPTPPAQPSGQDLVKQLRGQGFHKGTAKVQPMPAHGSWRGDKNGSVTAAEHAGVPHPTLAAANKKK